MKHGFTVINAHKGPVPDQPGETEISYDLQCDTGRRFTVYVACENTSTIQEVADAISAALSLFEYSQAQTRTHAAQQKPQPTDSNDPPARLH